MMISTKDTEILANNLKKLPPQRTPPELDRLQHSAKGVRERWHSLFDNRGWLSANVEARCGPLPAKLTRRGMPAAWELPAAYFQGVAEGHQEVA